MNRILFISLIAILFSCSTIRQNEQRLHNNESDRQQDPISELEVGNYDDELPDDDIEDVLLTLDELAQNPININTAQFDDLMRIPAMRPSYARAILRQRERVGRFASKSQYLSIPNVPSNTMSRLAPYLTLGSAAETIRQTILDPVYWTAGMRFESLTRIRGTLEKADGYRSDLPNKERVYLGPPVERYQRITVRSRHFTAGVQLRGAPGAAGLASQTILHTTHLSFTGLPIIGDVVAGKFKVSYGMGLSMGGSRPPRRGFDMRIPRSSSNTILPYSGSSYSLGHLGVAMSTSGKVKLTYWLSNRTYTSTSLDSSGRRWGVSEPQFRTSSEIDKRDNFSVKLAGARGLVRSGRYQFGLAGWTAFTSHSIIPVLSIYQDIGLRGRNFGVLSADIDAKYRNGSLSAEVALDAHAGKAVIVAGEALLGNGFEVLTIIRYYGADFQSPYGSAYGNWTGRPSNEVGWLASITLQPNRQRRYTFYNDLYNSILPRGTNFMPTSGNEFGVKYEQTFGLNEIHGTYKNRIRDEEADNEDPHGRLYRYEYKTTRSTARVDLITRLSQRATWVTRAEWVWATKEASIANSGYLIHQDLSWWISSQTRLQARVTIFHSDNTTSRLYTWEPDVGLASAMPSFQGKGSRQYILATFKPNARVEVKVKLARTQLPFEYTIGSGNDQIRDNKRTQLHTSLLIRI